MGRKRKRKGAFTGGQATEGLRQPHAAGPAQPALNLPVQPAIQGQVGQLPHRDGRGRGGDGDHHGQQPQQRRDAVTAPSRFSRINRRVHYPGWGPLVSHDVPFADGHNGEIFITITAKTPLLVSKGRDKSKSPAHVLPFLGPDGKYAIPGSSIQGMVRHNLAIATFGKLGPVVDNRRYAVRDIGRGETAREIYRKRMTEGDGGGGHPITSRVKTGWLMKGAEGKHAIYRCDMARIEIKEIATGNILKALMRDGLETDTKAYKDAPARYAQYLSGQTLAELEQDFFWPLDRNDPHHHSCGWMTYEKCQKSAIGVAFKGTLVITGKTSAMWKLSGNQMPQREIKNTKHMEFVFHNPSRSEISSNTGLNLAEARELETSVWRDFLLVHEAEKGSGGTDNPNWIFWRDEFKAGRPVPIFYLEENGGISAMGTAQMFKLAMPLSNHDMLANSNPEHIRSFDGEPEGETGKLDMPSLIFGTIGGKRGDWFRHTLKRRASFDMARLVEVDGKAMAEPFDFGAVALMSPKPSYYPISVRQPQTAAERQHGPRALYATFGKVDGHSPSELAGVKVWPTQGMTRIPPQNYNNTVLSQLMAVPVETSFTTVLRVHNLREVELGALLWALTFGQEGPFGGQGEVLRHRLGGGKPYGLGEVEIRISGMVLDRNDRKQVKTGPGIIKAFTDYMASTKDVGAENWSNSVQVKSLVKAATVHPYTGDDALEYIPGPKRHAELRNGINMQPGGYFLPNFVEGWEHSLPLEGSVGGVLGDRSARIPDAAPIDPANLAKGMIVQSGPQSGKIVHIDAGTVTVVDTTGRRIKFSKRSLVQRAE